MVQTRSFTLSDRGRSRRNNEDFVASFEPADPKELQASGCLYIVADGVGGESKGERASRYAAEKILYDYYQNPDLEIGQRLRQAMAQVNKDIFNYAQQSEHITRMATTLVAAVVRENTLTVANVGDSRAYLIRDGQVVQISRDHSLAGELLARGEISEAEAKDSFVRNRLTRSLGGESEVAVDVYPAIPLQTRDRILLCSDGLTRYANREKIGELTGKGSPQEIAERLIRYANECGGADNVSAIFIALQDTEAAAEPARAFAALPEPPDWETMDTEPPGRIVQKAPPTRHGWLRQIALGAALLFMVSAAGYVTLMRVGDSRVSVMTPTTAVDADVLSLPVRVLPPVALPLAAPEAAAATAVPTAINTRVPSPTASATSTTGVPVGIDASTRANCSYKLQKDDVLSKVAEKLGIGGNNYRRIFCDPESAKSGCDLGKPSEIQPGWIVIIPDVSIDVCTRNRGTALPAIP